MTPAQLRFSMPLWQATLNVLALYREQQVEAGCLWYGQREDDAAYATLVGMPKQINRRRNFEIVSDALAELNARIPGDLVVVAQVHSHPGRDTTHSPWDNDMMVSRKVFSLVLPFYGALPCDWSKIGMHAHDGQHWVKLPQAEMVDRLVVGGSGGVSTSITLVDTR